MYLDPQDGKEPMFKAAVRLLHNHGESLDPLQVLEVKPLSLSPACMIPCRDVCKYAVKLLCGLTILVTYAGIVESIVSSFIWPCLFQIFIW